MFSAVPPLFTRKCVPLYSPFYRKGYGYVGITAQKEVQLFQWVMPISATTALSKALK